MSLAPKIVGMIRHREGAALYPGRNDFKGFDRTPIQDVPPNRQGANFRADNHERAAVGRAEAEGLADDTRTDPARGLR
jgi:hypothetical protein